MTRETDDLIRRLTTADVGVRRLPRPWVRTATWLAISLPYLALLVWLWPQRAAPLRTDSMFVLEQAAALLTGLAAAAAAFATVVPGRSRTPALIALAPLVVWLAAIGDACVRDWSASHSAPPIAIHWACFPATLVAGALPAIAIVLMLRRGAPMTPRLSTALAALAVSGLANFAIRFVHTFDASFVVLAWHIVAVFALSAMAALSGDRVFSWRRRIAAARAADVATHAAS